MKRNQSISVVDNERETLRMLNYTPEMAGYDIALGLGCQRQLSPGASARIQTEPRHAGAEATLVPSSKSTRND